MIPSPAVPLKLPPPPLDLPPPPVDSTLRIVQQ
jgi:hypothetical protein